MPDALPDPFLTLISSYPSLGLALQSIGLFLALAKYLHDNCFVTCHPDCRYLDKDKLLHIQEEHAKSTQKGPTLSMDQTQDHLAVTEQYYPVSHCTTEVCASNDKSLLDF